jgi:diaminopimelate epimerase
MLHLSKAHAYGNDFLLVPADQVEGWDLASLARDTCARHTGVGGDGLIVYAVGANGMGQMRLFNADGSRSELSGNGLRCLAALMMRQRAVDAAHEGSTTLTIDTDAGVKTLALVGRNDGRYMFRAAMGPPADLRRETLDVLGDALSVTTLTMGNPQCVALVDRLPDRARFETLGPALATHPRFPAGTNVEFAHVETSDRVRILIWERGVGPTMASGTGACASAVAAIAHGSGARDVDVVAPGGTQRVEWREDGVYLTGWAEVVFEGHWLPAAR